MSAAGHKLVSFAYVVRRSPDDHLIVFGYYQDWKKQKGPVKKFYVVFRHKVLQEIAFFDPKDDVLGLAAGRDMRKAGR